MGKCNKCLHSRLVVSENGWDSEYEIFENDGRAVLTTRFTDRDDIVEWKIGTVYDPPRITKGK